MLAKDFLEHVPLGMTAFVVEEIWRVLEHDGMLQHMTPSTDGRGAFMDPTHLSFWNINSWLYWTDDRYRELYKTKAKFLGRNWDEVTIPQLNIVHTHGVLYAKKGLEGIE